MEPYVSCFYLTYCMEYEWNINGVSENLHYELVYFKELHNDNN